VQAHYACKANNDKMLLRLFAYLGSCFDCASKGEIEELLEFGVQPERIIFANPIKDITSLRFAASKGIDYMTFDSSAELYKIRENHSTAKVLLRIKTNDADAELKLSKKYGATMKTSFELIELCKRLDVNLVGIAFHVGCSNMKADVFEGEIIKSRELFDFARDRCGINMTILDIGGGYLGLERENNVFVEFSAKVNTILDRLFPEHLQIKIIAEPGRFFCQSAKTLCTKVIGKKMLHQSGDEVINLDNNNHQRSNDLSCMYYLNCGFFSGLMDLSYFEVGGVESITKLSMNDHSDHEIEDSLWTPLTTLWGPTCDSLDVIVRNRQMPECSVNDYLVFKEVGAYSIETKFNSCPLPDVVYASFRQYEEYRKAFA
jgi:ornithine decarboxylase